MLATILAAEASPKVDTVELYAFLFLLALFLGLELIAKVPAKLHTPLMSGSNAISGITLIGAMVLASKADSPALAIILGSAAVTFAAINVVGGYFVTDRMLEMFKKKEEPKGGQS